MSAVYPYTYKFKGRFPAIVVCGFMIGLLLAFALLIFRDGDGLGGVTIFIAGAFFFLCVGSVYFISKANIVIGTVSISRTIFGRQFKTIQWRDVERIAVFAVRAAGASSSVTGYNVIASQDRSSLSNTKKIYFGSQGGDMLGLIECINVLIAQYNIKVERIIDSVKINIKSL